MNTISFTRVNMAVVSAAIIAAAVLSVAVQYLSQAIQHGLQRSAAIRVSVANECSNDSAHFVGCSSIL